MNIRERLEEIWPVPEGVEWSGYQYVAKRDSILNMELIEKCFQWDTRLDTFTRCQETTSIHLSLIDEMAMEIEGLSIAAYGCVIQQSQDIVDRAKQLIGAKE